MQPGAVPQIAHATGHSARPIGPVRSETVDLKPLRHKGMRCAKPVALQGIPVRRKKSWPARRARIPADRLSLSPRVRQNFRDGSAYLYAHTRRILVYQQKIEKVFSFLISQGFPLAYFPYVSRVSALLFPLCCNGSSRAGARCATVVVAGGALAPHARHRPSRTARRCVPRPGGRTPIRHPAPAGFR